MHGFGPMTGRKGGGKREKKVEIGNFKYAKENTWRKPKTL